jgi:hypothetical protein
MADIRDHVPDFHLSFDYMAEAAIAKTTGDAGVTRLVDSFADMGAPWITGIRDVGSLADQLQLTVIDNVTSADLYRSYWPDRDISSPIFAYYSLCTLAS